MFALLDLPGWAAQSLPLTNFPTSPASAGGRENWEHGGSISQWWSPIYQPQDCGDSDRGARGQDDASHDLVRPATPTAVILDTSAVPCLYLYVHFFISPSFSFLSHIHGPSWKYISKILTKYSTSNAFLMLNLYTYLWQTGALSLFFSECMIMIIQIFETILHRSLSHGLAPTGRPGGPPGWRHKGHQYRGRPCSTDNIHILVQLRPQKWHLRNLHTQPGLPPKINMAAQIYIVGCHNRYKTRQVKEVALKEGFPN